MGSTLRIAGVILAIVTLPTIARSRDASAPVPACELSGEPVAPAEPDDKQELVSTFEPDAPHEPTVDDLRVAAGQHWRLTTPRGVVHVWTPQGYDAATAETVVFVHGYNTNVETMWNGAQLPQQFAHSRINAMFIAPDSPYAKLSPMLWPSLDALLRAVTAGTGQALPRGRVVAIGHSGAYRTLVLWMASRALQTVVLLDAAYGEFDRFAEWVRAARSHRFINIAYETQPFSEFMHRAMPGTVRVDGLPDSDVDFDDGARAARVLYVRTGIGHWPLVTGGVAIPAALRALGAPLLSDGS